MGKRKGKQLSSKDLRHLKEFGEAHPADVEDAKKRQKLQNEKDLGISSRKIIKAKPRDPLAKLISVEKGEKFPEPEIPEINENEASDSEPESDPDDLTREDLLELLKRESETERTYAENQIIDGGNTDQNELEIDNDDEDREAENTWLTHVTTEISDSDIIHIEDKKTYQSEKIGFQFYTKCKNSTPECFKDKKLEVFDDIDSLHIRDRLRRNMKKLETKEKELFSIFHQYKGRFQVSFKKFLKRIL